MDSSTRLGFWIGGTGIAASLAIATPAHATIIAQEGFGEYPQGLPPGEYGTPSAQSGITSWYSIGGNPWGSYVEAGSLAYPGLTQVQDATANDLQGTGSGLDVAANIDASAGGLFGQNGYVANSTNSFVGVPGKTLYFSFTSQIYNTTNGSLPPDSNNTGGDDQAFLQLGNNSNPTLTIGQTGNTFAADGVSLAPLTSSINFVVVEMNFAATPSADTAEVYYDPTSGTTPTPTLSLTGALEFNDIDFKQEINGMNWDDLRFGTTFADVTPGFVAVPEPASIIVLSPAAILFLRRRKRK
jgi:hypothetical protein